MFIQDLDEGSPEGHWPFGGGFWGRSPLNGGGEVHSELSIRPISPFSVNRAKEAAAGK